MAAYIRFTANDIQVDGMPIDVELTPAWLDEVLGDAGVSARPGGGPGGRLVGRLSRSGHDIVVRGRVKAAVELPCVRCLTPAPQEVDAELSLLLQPMSRSEMRRAPSRPDAEYEFSGPEADLDVYDGETVVLDDFVREAILLEMPSFPLCRESCPGLRQAEEGPEEQPGVDPRLAPLDAFRDKSSEPVTIDQLVSAARERAAALGRKPMLKRNRTSPGRKKR